MQRADTLWTDIPFVTHSFSASGIYTVKLFAFACGEIDTFSQTITIVGIEETPIVPVIQIYPNPAGNIIFVKYNLPDNNPEGIIILYNSLGEKINTWIINDKK